MNKIQTLTSATLLAACTSSQAANEPTAAQLYELGRAQPSITLPQDIMQAMLQRHQCEAIEGVPNQYRCTLTIAYYRKTGGVVLDKQTLDLHWQNGAWQRK
ncbi:hypothetical protein ACKLNO_00930 [Neisseriaceae bacterium B1]